MRHCRLAWKSSMPFCHGRLFKESKIKQKNYFSKTSSDFVKSAFIMNVLMIVFRDVVRSYWKATIDLFFKHSPIFNWYFCYLAVLTFQRRYVELTFLQLLRKSIWEEVCGLWPRILNKRVQYLQQSIVSLAWSFFCDSTLAVSTGWLYIYVGSMVWEQRWCRLG